MFFLANFSLALSSLGSVLLPLLVGQIVDTIRENGNLTEMAVKFIILSILMAVFASIKGFTFSILG